MRVKIASLSVVCSELIFVFSLLADFFIDTYMFSILLVCESAKFAFVVGIHGFDRAIRRCLLIGNTLGSVRVWHDLRSFRERNYFGFRTWSAMSRRAFQLWGVL